jgi:hypothetical protein
MLVEPAKLYWIRSWLAGNCFSPRGTAMPQNIAAGGEAGNRTTVKQLVASDRNGLKVWVAVGSYR